MFDDPQTQVAWLEFLNTFSSQFAFWRNELAFMLRTGTGMDVVYFRGMLYAFLAWRVMTFG